jgi:small subunit ribosomal protein S6
LKTYEGMFLLEAGQANFEEAVAPIRTIFTRNQVEVLHLKKWDERRLTYEIRGRRRGMYVLTYFKVDPLKITDIERDARLDEKVLRSLILQANEVSAETMAAATPAESHVGRADDRERGEDDDRDYRPRRREYGDDRGGYRGDYRRENRGEARRDDRDKTDKGADETPADKPAADAAPEA